MSKTANLPDNDLPGAMARARYVHITPMKARRVIDLIRGMSAEQALAVLQFAPQAAGEQVRKVVASAVANAENNDRLDRDDLIVTEAYVDEGPTIKRFRPRAQGRAYRIRKRTCHITVVVTAHPKDDKPVKRTGVARLAKKIARPGAKKASPVATKATKDSKATTATKATKDAPTKGTKATKPAAKDDKAESAKADKLPKASTPAKTSTSDKDASGTSKRRAH